ncbi:MAG: RNA polymerase Rpb4 family protein [Candidatus Jordarchaeales archaeon]
MPPKVLSEKCLTLSEVKELLEEREKEGRLSHAQKATLDYVRLFSKLSASKSRELVNLLVEKYELKELTATQIVNVLPQTVDELKVFLAYETKSFRKEELEGMVNLIREFSEKPE